VTLMNRIVRLLADEGRPVATTEITARCASGLSVPDRRVWRVLRRLLKDGIVTKETRRKTGPPPGRARLSYWRII